MYNYKTPIFFPVHITVVCTLKLGQKSKFDYNNIFCMINSQHYDFQCKIWGLKLTLPMNRFLHRFCLKSVLLSGNKVKTLKCCVLLLTSYLNPELWVPGFYLSSSSGRGTNHHLWLSSMPVSCPPLVPDRSQTH